MLRNKIKGATYIIGGDDSNSTYVSMCQQRAYIAAPRGRGWMLTTRQKKCTIINIMIILSAYILHKTPAVKTYCGGQTQEAEALD